MPSLDITCHNQVNEIEITINRLDSILSNKRIGSRRDAVNSYRSFRIVELYDLQNAHARYDARRREALEDGTGQDWDAVNIGENSGDGCRFNEAGEPRW
jgi:hypothetical protein